MKPVLVTIDKYESESCVSYQAIVNLQRNQKTEKASYFVKRMDGYKYTAVTKDGRTAVYARSPNLLFILHKTGPESLWKIAEYRRKPDATQIKHIEGGFYTIFGKPIHSNISSVLPNLTGLEFLDECKLYIDTILYSNDNSIFIKMKGNENAKLDYLGNHRFVGSLRFGMDNDKRMLKETFVRKLSNTITYPDGTPVTSSVLYTAQGTGNVRANYRLEVEYSDYAFDPIDKELFKLSYYSLPDIDASNSDTSHYYIYFICGSLTAFSLAILVWRFRAKQLRT